MSAKAVEINGEKTEITVRTVAELVAEVARDPSGKGTAVAINDRIVPKSRWSDAEIAAGDRIEIVEAAQGG